MSTLMAKVECQYGATDGLHMAGQATRDYPCGPYGCSKAAFGCPWGCIWLLGGSIWLPMGSIWLLRGCSGVPWGLHMASQRLHMAATWLLGGSIWLPMGLHMAAQRLHLAAEGLHFAAQGPSMAPMRQICSICCIWLGQAGVQDGREHGQVRLARVVWGP